MMHLVIVRTQACVFDVQEHHECGQLPSAVQCKASTQSCCVGVD